MTPRDLWPNLEFAPGGYVTGRNFEPNDKLRAFYGHDFLTIFRFNGKWWEATTIQGTAVITNCYFSSGLRFV